MAWQDVRGFYEEQDDPPDPECPTCGRLRTVNAELLAALRGWYEFSRVMDANDWPEDAKERYWKCVADSREAIAKAKKGD